MSTHDIDARFAAALRAANDTDIERVAAFVAAFVDSHGRDLPGWADTLEGLYYEARHVHDACALAMQQRFDAAVVAMRCAVAASEHVTLDAQR